METCQRQMKDLRATCLNPAGPKGCATPSRQESASARVIPERLKSLNWCKRVTAEPLGLTYSDFCLASGGPMQSLHAFLK
jgi:hypothetical protein